jgi:hypothetical protein
LNDCEPHRKPWQNNNAKSALIPSSRDFANALHRMV